MNCLEIIQQVSRELSGFAYPTAAITSSDPQILMLVALLNKEGKELARRPEEGWQALVKEATFTTVATEIQGSLEALAPNSKYIINDTIWNRSDNWPIFGSLTAQRWALEKGWLITGIYSRYRIQGNNIHFIPVPPAGQDCAFEYQSKAWATDGTTYSDSFMKDTDTSLLDSELLSLGLLWRWKSAKGFDYAEDFATYERAVEEAIGRDVPKEILSLANTARDPLQTNVQDTGFGS